MRNLGGIFILLLLVVAIVGGFSSVYFFTQLETDRSDLVEAQTEIGKLRDLVNELQESPIGGRRAPSEDSSRSAARTVATFGQLTKDGAKMSPSGTMILAAPIDDIGVGSPIAIAGRAIAFESTINVRVRDGRGETLVEAAAMTDAPDVGRFGDFTVELEFDKPSTSSGTVEIFEYSARDGAEINKVSVSVGF